MIVVLLSRPGESLLKTYDHSSSTLVVSSSGNFRVLFQKSHGISFELRDDRTFSRLSKSGKGRPLQPQPGTSAGTCEAPAERRITSR